jgi:hypothetical protein
MIGNPRGREEGATSLVANNSGGEINSPIAAIQLPLMFILRPGTYPILYLAILH